MSVLRDTLRGSLLFCAPYCLLSVALASWEGAAGAAIGIATADVEIAAMALLGHMLLGMPAGPRVVRLTLLFALLKLPLVAAAVFLAVRLGPASLECFLAGIGLVYCALVLAGLRQFKSQKRDLFP